MPVVMTTAYFLTALWTALITGAGVHALVTQHDHDNDVVAVYKINIDQNGTQESVCRESEPLRNVVPSITQ